ncbi:MAG: hypothetical protein ACREP2_12435, partial [Rhodanobacteraceae bacterium]
IAAWRYVKPADLDREIEETPDRFTPWLKMEWQRLRGDFADRLAFGGSVGRASQKRCFATD